MKLNIKIIMGLLFSSLGAFAQLSMLPEPMKAIPVLTKSHTSHIFINEFLNTFSEKQITELAALLETQFKKTLTPLTQPSPTCEKPELESYLLALQTSGRFDECKALAESCRDKTIGPKPFLIAALCASSRYQYAEADHFFEMATDPRWNTSSDYLENLFQRAAYSLYGHHEDQVDGILAQIPNSNQQSRKMWKALLQKVGEIDTGLIKPDQIKHFLSEQIKNSSGNFKGLLRSLQIRIAMRESRHDEAIQGLLDHAPEIQNPLYWYYVSYGTLYYGLDQNFSWARKIYDVYNRYANPWMSFPVENNTYNYTEIYGRICKNQLTQNNDDREFKQIKSDLRSGHITIESALQKLDLLKNKLGEKADYLSAYAGLQALQGKHQEAFQLYWRAHQLCPYYNRANWGLTIEKRFFQYSARPDYEELNKRIDRELEEHIVPDAIATYIVNWNSLNADVQKRVVYGSRIWLPYMQALDQYKMNSYIKYAYDLLSESPQLSDIRDERIGGANYPHDNRLWDDVRGVGGNTVVADLAEVYQAVQGDYNLLGHEMAHQFQFLMEYKYPKGYACIVDQYIKAKAKNNFPDSYSSQNKEEHFAQGVTYYLVPADAPSRFGLNQAWVKTNNPQQFNFVESIDLARGDFSKIACGN